MSDDRTTGAFLGTLFAWLVIFAIVGGMWGCPSYNVYERGKAGEAELAQANYNREIAVKEAEAKRDAAVSLAQAEVERAKGVAAANQIIGQSLKENEDYLRWLWIEGLKENQQQVIYIPTEGGMPILEAGKRP